MTNEPARSGPALIHVAQLADLQQRKVVVVQGPDRPIAVFAHEGKVSAVDNRCPHLGFPLHRGTVEDGILTCHWHHARFDLASGCTFDLWADDVPRYEVVVRDGHVYVDVAQSSADPRGHYLRRLQEGLEQDTDLIQAKCVIGLLEAGVEPSRIVREVALFGVLNRDDWASGLTSLTALANLAPQLERQTIYLAFCQGARRVASDCDGHPLQPLLNTLTYAAVREDADFHTFQMLEAAVRQLDRWQEVTQREHFLVAAGRFLAAHSPTQRTQLQTAEVALRLHRGDELHKADGDSEAAQGVF